MKVLILTTVLAPYRVKLFNEIGKRCELTVCFEQKKDSARDDKWYDNDFVNFKAVMLPGCEKPVKKIKPAILNIVNSTKPDLAVAYEYSTITAMLFMTYCKMKKIPYIINCDGAFITNNIKKIIKSHYIKNASGYIASGKMAKEYFLYYGAKENKIYYNNFTTLFKDDILEKVILPEEKNLIKEKLNIKHEKVILSIGQFIYRKGIDVLLNSLKMVNKSVGVYIIGGKPTDEYINAVNKYGLDNVYFMDFMRPDELKQYYLAADLFVLPTREDVWGLVINESMANGLPVITTDKCVAGIELIENDISGYIVPVNDAEKLGEAINKIILDDDKLLKMGKNNLNKISEYTIEKSSNMIYSAFEKIYKQEH